MKQTAFLRCFLTQKSVLANQTLNSENDSTGIVDLCPGCGRPHTAHPIAKISKVKHLAPIFIYQCTLYLAYQVFIFCQKSILSNRFATLFFTHLQPFIEMIIFGSKSCFRSGTFTNVLLQRC